MQVVATAVKRPAKPARPTARPSELAGKALRRLAGQQWRGAPMAAIPPAPPRHPAGSAGLSGGRSHKRAGLSEGRSHRPAGSAVKAALAAKTTPEAGLATV